MKIRYQEKKEEIKLKTKEYVKKIELVYMKKYNVLVVVYFQEKEKESMKEPKTFTNYKPTIKESYMDIKEDSTYSYINQLIQHYRLII